MLVISHIPQWTLMPHVAPLRDRSSVYFHTYKGKQAKKKVGRYNCDSSQIEQ